MLIRHPPMKERIERDQVVNEISVALSKANGDKWKASAAAYTGTLQTGQTIYNCVSVFCRPVIYTNGNAKMIN